MGIASIDAVNLVTDIVGYNKEAFDDIIYSKTGYNSFEDYLQYVDPETYDINYN